jgi:hypothetical protein
MRTALTIVLALGLMATGLGHSPAAGPESARALLDDAIKAHGGAEQLAKTRVLVRSDKGEMSGGLAAKVPFTREAVVRGPDQGRWSFEMGPDGNKLRVVLVLNRDKGWRLGAGQTADLGKQELEEIREEAYAGWVTTLLPLRDRAFTLTLVPETKVNGQPAVGLMAASKGRPDIKLFFDKKTNLLLKVERQGREAGKKVEKETFFGDYKEFGGVKLPAQVLELTGGKTTAEFAVTSYRFPGRVDESEFAKP